MKKDSKIYVAGHTGLVGSAIVRRLEKEGYKNLVCKTHFELDLTNPKETEDFFSQESPEYIFLAAAKVGGIHANNTYPADFIRDNLLIQTNVLDAAYRHKVKKLLFLGSSCIYPKKAKQPMKEEYLLTGPLEATNDAYAIAKIAGLFMCKSYNRQYGTNFIVAMPTNVFGPGDNFDLETSHVLAAMIRKFHEAKEAKRPSVWLWGTGQPERELLYVDDLADALLFLMLNFNADPERPADLMINVGTGKDLTIAELAEAVRQAIGYDGNIEWNTSMPDGTPKKLLDVSRLTELGWQAQVPLQEGIRLTYDWFAEHKAHELEPPDRTPTGEWVLTPEPTPGPKT